MKLDKQQIREILPHRAPFEFVDSVEEFDGVKRISAKFFADAALPFFKGHFPSRPIVPGVLIQEALAQTCGLLIAIIKRKLEIAKAEGQKTEPEIFYLAGAEMKFVSVAKPDETLELVAELDKKFGILTRFCVSAHNTRGTVAKGTIILAEAEKERR